MNERSTPTQASPQGPTTILDAINSNVPAAYERLHTSCIEAMEALVCVSHQHSVRGEDVAAQTCDEALRFFARLDRELLARQDRAHQDCFIL